MESPPKIMTQLAGHEIVGKRLVGALPKSELVDLWMRIASRIVKYGFVIEYRDLEIVYGFARPLAHAHDGPGRSAPLPGCID
jgi:hypothetical protein